VKGPSTAKGGLKRTPGQLSISFDTPITQVLTLLPGGTPVGPGNKDTDSRGNEDDPKMGEVGGSKVRNKLAHWQESKTPQEDETQHTFVLQSSVKDGSFTKACIELSRGENLVTEIQAVHHVYKKFMEDEDTFSPTECITSFGEQLAPFPFLAVMGPSNKVVVIHGIRKFVVPFCQTHKNGEDIIAFVNDNMDNNEFPYIIKLNEYDFEGTWDWPHPMITTIMNIIDGTHVLPVKGEKDKVTTSKLIPLPTFLVPHFINGGEA